MEKLLTVKSVAELTGYSKHWVYSRKCEGTLPFPVIKLGASLRFRESDVLRWIESNALPQN